MTNPDTSQSERFLAYGSDLAEAVEAALETWIRHNVERRLGDSPTVTVIDRSDLDRRLAAVTLRAKDDVGSTLRDLLARDPDDQWTNPLSVLRAATRYPTEILAHYGVPPVARDRHAARLHPDDVYDLTPGGFIEFGQEVQECGIRWGAAKAHLHLTRRKRT